MDPTTLNPIILLELLFYGMVFIVVLCVFLAIFSKEHGHNLKHALYAAAVAVIIYIALIVSHTKGK